MTENEQNLFSQLFPELSSKSQRKRMEILEAAISKIGEHGIESLTFDSVATQLSTNRAHVKYHYNDLQDVLADCMRLVTYMAQQTTIARLEGAANWRQQMRAIVAAALEHYEQNPAHALVMLSFYARSCTDIKCRTLYDEIRRAGRHRISLSLSAVLGSNPDDIARGQHIAQSIQNLVFGHIFDRAANGSFSPFETFKIKVSEEAEELLFFHLKRND